MMYREISVQKKLNHANIIRLYGHIEDIDCIYLILEYAAKGNLFHYIRDRKRLTEEETWPFFTQVCVGVNYLHQNSIIHRDLKPENILLNHNNTVKICDFGWCVEGNNERNTYCGTLDYMAPEIIKGLSYTNKVDVWALGVLLYELTHGYPPFTAKNDSDKSRLIRKGNFKFEDNISAECRDLVRSILRISPEARPSLGSILKHPWISKFFPIEEKLKINDFCLPGCYILDEELGQGIVVNSEGLICEISFVSTVKEFITTDLIKKIESLSTRATSSTVYNSMYSKVETKDKEFEMKLEKDYPPSYKLSPKNSKNFLLEKSIQNNLVYSRKINSEERIPPLSPSTQKYRSGSSKIGLNIDLANMSQGSNFSSNSEAAEENKTIHKKILTDRQKELEMLRASLEGKKEKPVMLNKKDSKGLFSRFTELFNIGCSERY